MRVRRSTLATKARLAPLRGAGKFRTGEGSATAVSKRSLRGRQGLGRLPFPDLCPLDSARAVPMRPVDAGKERVSNAGQAGTPDA